MSAPAIVVDAAIAPSERATIAAFGAQLAACLARASGDRWTIAIRAHDRIEAIEPSDGSHVVVASLQCELERDRAPAVVETRWRSRLEQLVPRSGAVLLCTIARCVAAPLAARPAGAPATIERIRRLNRVAIGLSHATGAAVADIDRIVAWSGARALGCDHRLASRDAAETAAWTILATFVGAGTLDDYAGPGATERARGYLGGLAELPRFVQKRLQAR